MQRTSELGQGEEEEDVSGLKKFSQWGTKGSPSTKNFLAWFKATSAELLRSAENIRTRPMGRRGRIRIVEVQSIDVYNDLSCVFEFSFIVFVVSESVPLPLCVLMWQIAPHLQFTEST